MEDSWPTTKSIKCKSLKGKDSRILSVKGLSMFDPFVFPLKLSINLFSIERERFFSFLDKIIIANINNHKSPRNRKVRDTIVSIVDEFFRCNNSTLLYICETGDNKQRMRSRLFEYWFSTYNRKALFTIISSSIVDAEGVVNFATIILRNDNPELSEIIVEFTESIQLLSQKPE